MSNWNVTYRTKNSPYIVGMQKRLGRKLKDEFRTVVYSSNYITTRRDALIAFKKLHPWIVVTSMRKANGGK